MSIVDTSEVLLAMGLTGTVTDKERALALMSATQAEGAVKRFLKYDPVYAERTEYYPQLDVTRTSRDVIWEVTDTKAFQRFLTLASANLLQVQHLPLRSVTALYIDYDGRFGAKSGAFASDTQKIEGTDFWPQYDSVDSSGNKYSRDGQLKSVGLWPALAGSVKIVYYAGYKAAELRGQDTIIDASPIWTTCLDEAVRRMNKILARGKKTLAGFSGLLTSERLGDYSYSADPQLLAQLVGGTDLLPESIERLMEYENIGWMLAS